MLIHSRTYCLDAALPLLHSTHFTERRDIVRRAQADAAYDEAFELFQAAMAPGDGGGAVASAAELQVRPRG